MYSAPLGDQVADVEKCHFTKAFQQAKKQY